MKIEYKVEVTYLLSGDDKKKVVEVARGIERLYSRNKYSVIKMDTDDGVAVYSDLPWQDLEEKHVRSHIAFEDSLQHAKDGTTDDE